jgi:inosose dehydratase
MRSPITITTAPCCWGVDDVNNPHLPAWEKVLDEAQEAGFGGLELGPYGYLPLDLRQVSAALVQRGLKIVAGTIFDDLVTPSNLDNLIRQTDEICALITQLPKPEVHQGQRYAAPYLTVMDWGHDARDFAAGHSERAPRLDDKSWQGMIDNIRAIATLARDKYGVRTTIHPHAGG